LLVHVPIINFFFHDLNNLQLSSSTVQYNWRTKDMWPIQIKSLYCHNTMNARVQVVKVFCANCSMRLWITNIEYICNTYTCAYIHTHTHTYIYIYIYTELNTYGTYGKYYTIQRAQNENKIINTIITVHHYLCSAVQYKLVQTECQGTA
jgi:hypothetical protein